MKKFMIIMVLCLFSYVLAQGFDGPPPKNKKMEQIINARLIQVLNLDENTSIRFFSRLNEHREKTRELSEKRNSILRNLQNELKNKNGGYFSLIETSLNLENQITAEKNNFITNLKDILTEEQLASYIIFEIKLRKEVKNLIMDRRKMRSMKNNRRNPNGF